MTTLEQVHTAMTARLAQVRAAGEPRAQYLAAHPLERLELEIRADNARHDSLTSFTQELAAATPLQLEHLARRAEGRYTTDLGRLERDLVNAERDRRAAAGIQVTA